MSYPQLNLFYNTTNESMDVVAQQSIKNKAQQDRVLKIFTKVCPTLLTPFDVQRVYEKTYQHTIPITSIRRSITNLCSAGKLEKTLIKRKEKLGANNCMWRLKQPKNN